MVLACPGSRGDVAVNQLAAYRVAAYPMVRGRILSQVPESKHHAYLDQARTTVCGFGVAEMQLFPHLRFTASPPSVRCVMCDRVVRAAAR
jgi:hypothetical protein